VRELLLDVCLIVAPVDLTTPRTTCRTDFLAAMEALVAKRERFDYVLVETTGLADPSSIASTFWVDDGLEIDMALDAIVTVIDAKHLERHLSSDAKETSSSHKVCTCHSTLTILALPHVKSEWSAPCMNRC
jgi:hypothetical protein